MISTYIQHIYPTVLIQEMMFGSGDCGSGITSNRYRDLGFKDVQGNWWRDGTHSIQNKVDLQRVVGERRPYQIHIDSLHHYDTNGKETLVQREIVFDIDATDFVRYCDCERDCCTVCWLHIEGASLILNYLLTKVFIISRRDILWVLSGKKGIHCLVNDAAYLLLGLEQRKALYNIMYKNTLDDMALFASTLPPDFIQTIEEMFYKEVIERRSLLDKKDFHTFCLATLRSRYPSLHYPILTQWGKGGSSPEKWNQLLGIEESCFGGGSGVKPSTLIALHLYYPRIDKGPLCEKRHLYKLPFSIHTDTKKVGLPVELEDIRKVGLPSATISLSDVVSHYYDYGGEIHPDFVKGAHLLQTWLQK